MCHLIQMTALNAQNQLRHVRYLHNKSSLTFVIHIFFYIPWFSISKCLSATFIVTQHFRKRWESTLVSIISLKAELIFIEISSDGDQVENYLDVHTVYLYALDVHTLLLFFISKMDSILSRDQRLCRLPLYIKEHHLYCQGKNKKA